MGLSGLGKIVEIPTGHVCPQSIETKVTQCCQPYDFRSKKYSFYSWLLFTPGPNQITILMFGKKGTFLVPFPSVSSQILVGIAAFLH